MREDFLHFIWRTHQFSLDDLHTTDGKKLQILNFGILNNHGGPDFKSARIRIGNVVWAGHIEMHLCSSDWNKHGHSEDPAYRNVILHVVLEDDEPVVLNNGKLPCLEIRGLIKPGLLHRYQKLNHLHPWVPCEGLLPRVELIKKELCLERMAAARLESRQLRILETLAWSNGDWENTAYVTIARGFGFKTNGNAFERLAKLLPLNIIRKYADRPILLEALVFGTAGMLNRIFSDRYPASLQREFNHLASKHSLIVMNESEWNRGRLRPSNQPSVRLSQFVQFIIRNGSLMALVTDFEDPDTLVAACKVPVSGYWEDHSAFDHPGVRRKKVLGAGSALLLLVNSLLPLMFVYGRYMGQESLCRRALSLLGGLPAERNSLLDRWESTGMPNTNALQSQGLIQLKGSYCDRRRCTECSIGAGILLSEV